MAVSKSWSCFDRVIVMDQNEGIVSERFRFGIRSICFGLEKRIFRGGHDDCDEFLLLRKRGLNHRSGGKQEHEHRQAADD